MFDNYKTENNLLFLKRENKVLVIKHILNLKLFLKIVTKQTLRACLGTIF